MEEFEKMKKLSIVGGKIYLGDMEITCVKHFKVESSASDSNIGVAELSITLDVVIDQVSYE